MKIAEIIFILACCYYTLTYAKSLWVDEKNKLGAVGAGLAGMIGTVGPVIMLLAKQ